MKRRQVPAAVAALAGSTGRAVAPQQPLAAKPLPRPLATFRAGTPGRVDLSPRFDGYMPGQTQLRLRANPRPRAGAQAPPLVSLESQCPEYRLEGSVLHYDGSAAGALDVGASAVRVQIEAGEQGYANAGAVVASEIGLILVDSPRATIRHGLDGWESFQALARDVMGTAPAGSTPRGRTDLIGRIFEITPGMLSEDATTGARPVLTIPFPCTVKALDPRHRPVLRSVSGERDIVQVLAQGIAPIDGEVVLQDLVIRDNRAWYDSGEAGVRIKDRFPGRSVRIERCEFVRCQNAVSGGSPGQTLRIVDCRIVDCGFGVQAHAVYVQPQWLEFSGNLVMHTPGARLAQAHLLKSRALNSRIVGNRFVMNDCPGSYLIDLPNGGDAEVVGNWLEFGPASDNSFATLIAYAAEGAAGDDGGRERLFAPGRGFRLVVRNNTMVSDFFGPTHFVSLHQHVHPHADGGTASTLPNPLQVADNLWYRQGPGALVLRRDRTQPQVQPVDLSATFAGNLQMSRRPSPGRADAVAAEAARNSAGSLQSRRFSGHTTLGTGSQPHRFETTGAG